VTENLVGVLKTIEKEISVMHNIGSVGLENTTGITAGINCNERLPSSRELRFPIGPA
jgi:hypothetical protein